MLFTRGNRQLGYAIITDPAFGQPEEHDSLTCGHNGETVWMEPFQPGEAMGGRCNKCDRFICMQCVAELPTLGCIPLEKRLEEIERLGKYT